jgi:hypothetical protein
MSAEAEEWAGGFDTVHTVRLDQFEKADQERQVESEGSLGCRGRRGISLDGEVVCDRRRFQRRPCLASPKKITKRCRRMASRNGHIDGADGDALLSGITD